MATLNQPSTDLFTNNPSLGESGNGVLQNTDSASLLAGNNGQFANSLVGGGFDISPVTENASDLSGTNGLPSGSLELEEPKSLSPIAPINFLENIKLHSQHGVISIQGTIHNDTVVVDADTENVTITVRGIGRKSFAHDEVESIRFFAIDGDDAFYNRTALDSIAFGGAGKDTFVGGEGRDVFRGGAGADTIRGRDGADRLIGEFGRDQIFGGDGFDELLGNQGDDLLRGGNGNDMMFGHDGDDYLYGGDGIDRLTGSIGDDLLNGGGNADEIFAGVGIDLIFGGRGNDLLKGGLIDQIIGGPGIDIGDFFDRISAAAEDLASDAETFLEDVTESLAKGLSEGLEFLERESYWKITIG